MLFIELSIITFSIYHLQKIKINTYTISITLFIWILALLMFMYFEVFISIPLLFITIIICLCFHTNFLKVFIDLTSIIFIGILSDSLAQIILQTSESTYLQLLVFILIYIFLFITLNLVLKIAKENIKIETIALVYKIILALFLCVTIIVLYLNIFIPSTYEELKLTQINLIIQLGYLTLISILFILQIKIIKKENVLKNKQIKQSQYNEYLFSLESINQDMQKFQHDYMNILITMDGYISQNDIEGLKSYFSKKIVKVEQDTLLKNQFMKNISNLSIIELKGLLITKLLLITEKNIQLQIEIPQKISEIPMDIIDFSRILGILVDNAIEASEDSQLKIINLAIIKTLNGSILLIMENSFASKLDINQIYIKGYSSKLGNNRGRGLLNLTEIINKYPNVLLNTRVDGKLFIQELELKFRK